MFFPRKYHYYQIRIALHYDNTLYTWFLNLYGGLQPILYFVSHACFHLASLSLIVFVSNRELVLIKRLLTSAHSVASLWGAFLSFNSHLFSESPFCSLCCPFCCLDTVRLSAVADEIMRETWRRLWSGLLKRRSCVALWDRFKVGCCHCLAIKEILTVWVSRSVRAAATYIN